VSSGASVSSAEWCLLRTFWKMWNEVLGSWQQDPSSLSPKSVVVVSKVDSPSTDSSAHLRLDQ
jgi:hypothetical protein